MDTLPEILPGQITVAGFCAGVGMLELGIDIALTWRGLSAIPVCICEWEAITAAALVARMEAAYGYCPPVWNNIATFDGARWRRSVDIACAGLPCPSYSSAGKRAGNQDNRAWGNRARGRRPRTWGPQPHFLRIVDEMRPAMVFLENVPQWVTGGHFRRFGETLSGLGYTIAQPLFIAAQDVGAPHKRERVFVMAISTCNMGHAFRARVAELFRLQKNQQGRPGIGDGCHELADAKASGCQGHESAGNGRAGRCTGKQRYPLDDAERQRARAGNETEQTEPASGGRCGFADASDELGYAGQRRCNKQQKQYESIGKGVSGNIVGSMPIFPPARNDYRSWATVAELDTARMPAIESGLSVVVDGDAIANRDILRIGGNAVCPLQAAIAFHVLLDQMIDS